MMKLQFREGKVRDNIKPLNINDRYVYQIMIKNEVNGSWEKDKWVFSKSLADRGRKLVDDVNNGIRFPPSIITQLPASQPAKPPSSQPVNQPTLQPAKPPTLQPSSQPAKPQTANENHKNILEVKDHIKSKHGQNKFHRADSESESSSESESDEESESEESESEKEENEIKVVSRQKTPQKTRVRERKTTGVVSRHESSLLEDEKSYQNRQINTNYIKKVHEPIVREIIYCDNTSSSDDDNDSSNSSNSSSSNSEDIPTPHTPKRKQDKYHRKMDYVEAYNQIKTLQQQKQKSNNNKKNNK